MNIIKPIDVEKYVYGGAVLGGGGGGSISEGLKMGKLATQIKPINLLDIEEMDEEDVVVTVSVVGTQSRGLVLPWHHIRTIKLLERFEVKIDGFIGSECGPMAITHGWIQSAVYNKPLVDCPCDGRAHPTAIMGAIGLHKVKDYISIQAATGGERNLEIIVRGDIETTSRIIRLFSIEAGGMVAVSRNPVKIEYLARNGAKGAIKQAGEVGEAMLDVEKPLEKIEAAMKTLGGRIICIGEVRAKRLLSKGGFDVGFIDVIDEENNKYKVTFVNEYISLHEWDNVKATFPDLINIFNLETGLPLNSTEVELEKKVVITHVDSNKIKLGSGLMDIDVYKPIEKILLEELNLEVAIKRVF
ncbi:MAG: DUF917 family protein [Candidatus Methanomethylicia archaeon]